MTQEKSGSYQSRDGEPPRSAPRWRLLESMDGVHFQIDELTGKTTISFEVHYKTPIMIEKPEPKEEVREVKQPVRVTKSYTNNS